MARANANNPAFSISANNQIAVRASRASASDGATFATEEALANITADWPASRLVAVWNNLAGVKHVAKFTDRKTAIRRIWAAVQQKAPRAAQSKPQPASAEGVTKSERVIALLRQPTGATLAEIMAATKWQSHSVRGFISGQLVKKQRLKVKSFKRDGERVYRIRA